MSYPPPYQGPDGSEPSAPPPYRAPGAAGDTPPPYPGPGPAGDTPPPYPGPGESAPPPYSATDTRRAAPPPYRPHADAEPVTAGSGDGEERYPLAEWWQRAVARVIDTAVLVIPVSIAAAMVSAMWAGAQTLIAGYSSAVVERNAVIIFSVCFFLLFTAYDAVCVARWRRTLGKHLMGLRVAPLGGAGRPGPIPLASIVARGAVFHVGGLASFAHIVLTLLVSLAQIIVFWLMPLWDRPNRQGLHDKIATTVVLRVR